MIFDSSKLKGLIREKGLTQEIVAKEIGIACSTFNVLEIPKTEIYEYFFTIKVEKTKQK